MLNEAVKESNAVTPTSKSRLRWEMPVKAGYYLQRLRPLEMSGFYRQLSVMLAAGITLNRALKVLSAQYSKPAYKQVLELLIKDLEKGLSLAEATAKQPLIFPGLVVSMIKAAEISGRLPEILLKISEYIQAEYSINKRIKNALIYPSIVILAIFAVLIFMLLYVLPVFEHLFATAEIALPRPTLFLLKAGGLLRFCWPYIILFLLLSLCFLSLWMKSGHGKMFIHRTLFKLPIIGKIMSCVISSRFTFISGLLLESGVALLETLQASQEAAGNPLMQKALLLAQENLARGGTLTASLEQSGLFDVVTIQMIAAGEESGSLGGMFMAAADYLKKESELLIDSSMALIEPLLILLISVLVGALVWAVLLPVLDLTTLSVPIY